MVELPRAVKSARAFAECRLMEALPGLQAWQSSATAFQGPVREAAWGRASLGRQLLAELPVALAQKPWAGSPP